MSGHLGRVFELFVIRYRDPGAGNGGARQLGVRPFCGIVLNSMLTYHRFKEVRLLRDS
jgi:hypothetical protein